MGANSISKENPFDLDLTFGFYPLHLQPYTGYVEKPTNDCDLGSSSNVVYYLAKILRSRYENLPLSITMYNYFSSFPVFEEVKKTLILFALEQLEKIEFPKIRFVTRKLKSPRGAFSKKILPLKW